MSGRGRRRVDRERSLVGRDDVLAALARALRSSDPSSSVVWIDGEAGTGKTSVLDAALEVATAPRVLRVRAEPMDPDRPFGVASRLLDVDLHDTSSPGRTHPVDPDPLASTDGAGASSGEVLTVFDQLPGRRHRIASALQERATELIAGGRLVAVVDDAQWVDDASFWVLEGLLEAGHPTTVIVAGRAVEDPSPPAARLARRAEAAGERWGLGPLDGAEVDELVERLVAAPAGEGVRRLVDRAAGNPMLVTELVAAARRRGWLVRRGAATPDATAQGRGPGSEARREGRASDVGRAEVVVDLDDRARPHELVPKLALSRLDEIDEDERELLRVAAVLGTTFTLSHVAAMVDRPAATLLPVLERLVAIDLLVSDRGDLGFRHDLVRESVYDEVAEWARAALHAHAATVLRDGGAPDVEVAHHLRRGAPVVDVATGGAFRRAGQALLHTDPTAARSLLERALELTPEPDPSIVADLVLATTWAGEPQAGERLARDHLASSAPGPSPDGSASGTLVDGRITAHVTSDQLGGGAVAATGTRAHGDAGIAVRHALAHNLMAQGRLGEAADEVEAVAHLHGARERRRFRAEAALVRALAFQQVAAAGTATELLDGTAPGAGGGVDVGTCVAWCARSWVDAQEGRAAASVQAAERAIAAAGDATAALRYHPHYFLAQALLGADHFDRFDEVAAEGRALSARLGTVWQLPVWSSTIAAKHLRSGEWDKALAETEVGLGWARDTGSRVGVPWLWCYQALVAFWRGEADEAEGRLAAAEEALGDDLRPGADGVLWVRGLLAEDRGDLEAALRSLGVLWDLVEGLGVVARMPTIGPDVVRVALAAGDRARAVRVVDALDRHRDVPGPPSFSAGSDRCRGLLAGDADLLVRACATYEGAPTITEAAMAEADAAVLLAAGGNPERAGAHARAARARFDRLGADLLTGRLRRSVGEDVLGADGTPDDPRALLSPAELRVAGLVAAGASNPEVAEALHVSRRTVESHLSHIFTKLGIRSRVDLAVLMADHR